MFTAARLKLTGWYLLIIMVISGLFSVYVYRSLTIEISRGLRLQVLRDYPFGPPPDYDLSVFDDARNRVAVDLLLVNGGILVVSGFAAYFLAGKTLHPIEVMVEDQKRFVADASHELRTPLTAMKTEIEVALRDKKLAAKEALDLLASNLEEVNKMQSLSNYLLSLNRYQNSAVRLAFTRVYLSEVVSKAVSGVGPLAAQKHLSLDVRGEDVGVSANLTSLVELTTLLLDNAIKYSHPDNRVVITTGQESRQAFLSVQDFGVGIKAGDLPYIFNRFYRADSSRNKTQVDGYGLGLSIAKNIAELNHGTISVDSAPGTGSTFTLKVPLSFNS